MALFVKQFLRIDGNFLQKRRKTAAADARPPQGRRSAAPYPPPSCPTVPDHPSAPPGSP